MPFYSPNFALSYSRSTVKVTDTLVFEEAVPVSNTQHEVSIDTP